MLLTFLIEMYPKINKDLYSRTISGGVITLVSSSFMLLLFFFELNCSCCSEELANVVPRGYVITYLLMVVMWMVQVLVMLKHSNKNFQIYTTNALMCRLLLVEGACMSPWTVMSFSWWKTRSNYHHCLGCSFGLHSFCSFSIDGFCCSLPGFFLNPSVIRSSSKGISRATDTHVTGFEGFRWWVVITRRDVLAMRWVGLDRMHWW